MAVTPNTDTAFLREVDEELRRDELARAWRRYGIAAVAVVLLGVLAYGGWLFWQSRQQAAAGAQGEALSKAFDDLIANHPDAARAGLAGLRTSDSAGYRALAKITEADLMLQKQNLPGAAAAFAQVAGDPKVGQPLRDLALIRQTTAEFDTLKPDVVVARLRGLAVKGNPWFSSAGELVAIAYLRMNQRDVAARLFAQIAGADGVPPSTRQRVVQMAGVLGVDAIDQSEGKAAK